LITIEIHAEPQAKSQFSSDVYVFRHQKKRQNILGSRAGGSLALHAIGWQSFDFEQVMKGCIQSSGLEGKMIGFCLAFPLTAGVAPPHIHNSSAGTAEYSNSVLPTR
jgi:hypothetical protein